MASLKKAIADKCKDCTYDNQVQGTWREQVELCTISVCALWPVRPVTVATANLARKLKYPPNPIIDMNIDIDALVNDMEDDPVEIEA